MVRRRYCFSLDRRREEPRLKIMGEDETEEVKVGRVGLKKEEEEGVDG